MNFDYAKDSKEQRPYEHYLNAYKSMNPKEISERTGFPYDEATGNFTVHLMGSTYLGSFPDYEIQPVRRYHWCVSPCRCYECENSDYPVYGGAISDTLLWKIYYLSRCSLGRGVFQTIPGQMPYAFCFFLWK